MLSPNATEIVGHFVLRHNSRWTWACVEEQGRGAIRTAVVLLLAWGIVLATGEAGQLGQVSRKAWLFLTLSGLATGGSWLFYFAALQRGPAAVVASVDKSSLAMVLVLAALFLGEPLTWKTGVGGGLVVLGAILVALR
jgi:transporter family protein